MTANIERFEAVLPMAEFLEQYRSESDRIGSYCKECRNFGRCWLCPPFDYDPLQRFCQYSSVRVFASKIYTGGDSSLTANRLFEPERRRVEALLRDLEVSTGGFSLAFAGKCLYCSECSRLNGEPCRHPELARPSLESWGIDVVRLSERLFGIPLLWSADPLQLPEYLTFVSALLIP